MEGKSRKGSSGIPESPQSRRRRLLPEDLLERAIQAPTARAKETAARRGLAFEEEIDRTTEAMLRRQLYLSLYARKRFEEAYQEIVKAVDLNILRDVVHQDAARAKQALGAIDEAVGHLRLAARSAPPSRRAFHWWTLGSVLFLASRNEDAIRALERAVRWATQEKPLYQGHLALAKLAVGRRVRSIPKLIERLDACPAGQGYGRFVLGQLAYAAGRHQAAGDYLRRFVERAAGRDAMALALHGEVEMARQTLEAIAAASSK